MAQLAACLVLVLAIVGLADAGSYLGCFDKTKWLYSVKAYTSVNDNGKPWTLATCEAYCAGKTYPLSGLSASYTECLCGITVPNGGAQIADSRCTAVSGEATALYYRAWGEP
jgi:hypothetical protein